MARPTAPRMAASCVAAGLLLFCGIPRAAFAQAEVESVLAASSNPAAIKVYTAKRVLTMDANGSSAAYSWRMDKDLGSIEAGKIANFTVLEEDPYAVDPLHLKDIKLWGTVFEGEKFPIAPKPTSP
jgi:predicted amidohydrolase YtcJ